jgi:mannose-binding lectin 1
LFISICISQLTAEKGGYIRGFLNDGNTDFKSHHSVDSLAFGHCQYSYRNLGRPSRIAVRQSADNFVVEVDGRVCFESPKIRLPTGYQFGVTAASADNPDSFEVFKLVVTTEFSSPEAEDPTYQAATPRTDASNLFNKAEPISIQDIPDEPASAVKADAQFADLHNRLQIMMKHISALNRDVVTANGEAKARMDELDEKIRRLEKATDRLNSMDRKLGEIQGDVRQTKKDLQSTLDKGVAGLKTVVADTHRTMLGSLAASAPSLMGYILVAVGSQALTVAAYLLYKRRKAASPKKYL